MNLKRVAIAYPSGNVTALVFDQLLEKSKDLDRQIKQAWKQKNEDKVVEQCCFITMPKSKEAVARVEMLGGEFCANATRSAIWLITKGQNYKGLIEVSGASKPLAFEVKNEIITLVMPLPEKELIEKVSEGILIHLEGLTHLVVTDPAKLTNSTPKDLFESLYKNNTYGLQKYPAVGVTFF